MKHNPRSLYALALVVPLIVAYWPGAAAAAATTDDAAAILAKVDRAQSPGKDEVGTMTMTITDKSGDTKVRKLETKQLGSKLRWVRFSSPAEVKGVTFLSRGAHDMYIYMPEFGKVRRIASHTKNESFMGSDFSYDDIGSNEMASKYNAKILEKDGNQLTLQLVPKDPDDTDVGHCVVVVDTRHYLVVKSDYYDKSGKLWKTMTQADIREDGGHWLAHRITMRNLRDGSSTTVEYSAVHFDTGLKDSDFTQRKMKRGI